MPLSQNTVYGTLIRRIERVPMSRPTDQELPLTDDQFRAMKQADRLALAALPPDEAQALVEALLQPRLWQIDDPSQLAWPGDLADDDQGE